MAKKLPKIEDLCKEKISELLQYASQSRPDLYDGVDGSIDGFSAEDAQEIVMIVRSLFSTYYKAYGRWLNHKAPYKCDGKYLREAHESLTKRLPRSTFETRYINNRKHLKEHVSQALAPITITFLGGFYQFQDDLKQNRFQLSADEEKAVKILRSLCFINNDAPFLEGHTTMVDYAMVLLDAYIKQFGHSPQGPHKKAILDKIKELTQIAGRRARADNIKDLTLWLEVPSNISITAVDYSLNITLKDTSQAAIDHAAASNALLKETIQKQSERSHIRSGCPVIHSKADSRRYDRSSNFFEIVLDNYIDCIEEAFDTYKAPKKLFGLNLT